MHCCTSPKNKLNKHKSLLKLRYTSSPVVSNKMITLMLKRYNIFTINNKSLVKKQIGLFLRGILKILNFRYNGVGPRFVSNIKRHAMKNYSRKTLTKLLNVWQLNTLI